MSEVQASRSPRAADAALVAVPGMRIRHLGHGRDRLAPNQDPVNAVVLGGLSGRDPAAGLRDPPAPAQLGIRRYETAWAMLQKLRRAMVRPDRELLKERVEVDETYIGGPEAGLRGGRQVGDKAIVVGTVEVRGRASGRVRLQVVPDVSARSLTGFVRANVAHGAVVLTDAWGGSAPLSERATATDRVRRATRDGQARSCRASTGCLAT